MIKGGLVVEAQRNILEQSIDVYIADRGFIYETGYEHKKHFDIANPLTFKTHTEGESIGKPAFSMTYQQAQNLIDSLFRDGIRPSDYRDESSQVQALKDHIKDLQKMNDILLNKVVNNNG